MTDHSGTAPSPQAMPDTATPYQLSHQTAALHANASVRVFNERMNLMEAYARRHRLRGNSLDMLLWLYYSPTALSQHTLAERTHSTKQVVNMTITGWRERGFVETTRDGNDGRKRLLRLTEHGRTWAKPILDQLRNAEIRAMSALTEDQQEQLIELATIYMTVLRAELDPAPERPSKEEA